MQASVGYLAIDSTDPERLTHFWCAVLGVEAPAAACLAVAAQGDHVAVIGENRKLLVFPIGQIPEMARGKFYGNVQFSVTLKPDGSIYSYEMLRTSGYSVLDRAAESIVRMGAPYAAISAKVLKGNDLLVITLTMIFARGDRIFSN